MAAGTEQTDMDLIRAYLDGDAASFDTLYEKYKKPLYGFLKNILRERNDQLDDLFQKTWLKAIGHLGKYRDQEKFSAWLMRIAANLAYDTFRSEKRHPQEEFDEKLEVVLPAADSFSPDSGIKNRELAEAIEEAIGMLSPEIRTVFLMRKEEIPFREIAEIQKCSINTCLARMQYALKKLRSQLAGWMEQ